MQMFSDQTFPKTHSGSWVCILAIKQLDIYTSIYLSIKQLTNISHSSSLPNVPNYRTYMGIYLTYRISGSCTGHWGISIFNQSPQMTLENLGPADTVLAHYAVLSIMLGMVSSRKLKELFRKETAYDGDSHKLALWHWASHFTYRHISFYCTWLYCVSHILCFLQIECL